MKYLRVQNFIDFFRWIVGRVTVWYECLSECECTFEIDEEDCPTQPGRSCYRYFMSHLLRLILFLQYFDFFLFLSLPLPFFSFTFSYFYSFPFFSLSFLSFPFLRIVAFPLMLYAVLPFSFLSFSRILLSFSLILSVALLHLLFPFHSCSPLLHSSFPFLSFAPSFSFSFLFSVELKQFMLCLWRGVLVR
jgi:hypothetical protein